jgi:integrase
MPRLTDATMKNAKVGEHSDAQTPGLTFIVRASTSKQAKSLRRLWSYRFSLGGKRQKMGLGSYPAVSLEDARRRAREAAAMVAKGLDPRLARRADPANLTFRDAAEAYLVEALPRYPSARGKHSLQHALRVHCAPLHGKPVIQVGTRDVANLLRTIAANAPPTAERVRGALRGLFASVAIDMEDLGVVMRDPVTSAGLRAAHYVPAGDGGRLSALAPSQGPEFMHALRELNATDARLLEFVILTVSRAGAARAATFEQINSTSGVWRIPATQLKDARFRKGEPFAVPLAPRALGIVEEMRAKRPNAPSSAPIFTDPNGAPLNDMALVTLLRRMCRVRPWLDPTSNRWVTTHGFRSTFRTWCQDTRRDREVVEIAMGHRFHGAVESRYARGDLLRERTLLLHDWARYLDTPPAGAEIIPLRA